VVEDELNGRPYTVRTLMELAAVARARGGPDASARVDALTDRAQRLAADIGLDSILDTCH
jgi:hypothetical protein